MENIINFAKLMEKIGTPEFDNLLTDFKNIEHLTDDDKKQMQEIFAKHWEITKIKADAALNRISTKTQLKKNTRITPLAYRVTIC